MPFVFARTKLNRVINPKLNCKRLGPNGYGSKLVTLGMHRPKRENHKNEFKQKSQNLWHANELILTCINKYKVQGNHASWHVQIQPKILKKSTQGLYTSTEGPRGRTEACEHRVWKRVHVSSWVELSPLPFCQGRQSRTRLIGSGQSNSGEWSNAVCHELSQKWLGSCTKEIMQITKLCRVDLPSTFDKSLVIKSRHNARLNYSRKIRQRTPRNNESSWRRSEDRFIFYHRAK